MQTYGLSTRLRDHVDDLHDDFTAFSEDGMICQREMRALRHKIAELTAKAAHLDDTVRLATSGLKVGFHGERIQRQVKEQRDLHDRPVCFVTEKQKRSNRGNGPSAA